MAVGFRYRDRVRLCPECGAPMKLRQARGNYFLGCSKYPRCKGTREATPEILEQVAAAATS